MKMIKKIILIALFIIVSGYSSIYAQLPVAFEAIRNFPEDTLKWNELQALFENKKFNESEKFAYSFADSCYKINKTEDFLFIMNQTAANILVFGKDIEKATSILFYAEEKALKNKDTINVEYAMLMKYIATSYFYKYEDSKSLQYYLKGLKIAQQLKEDGILKTDFLMNVGNMYVNTGEFEKAIPYLDKALKRAIKDKIPTVFMLTSQSFGYIASYRDKEIAIEFYKKIEQIAVNLDMEKNHYNKYMANICNTMSALYKGTNKEKLAAQYEKKAYKYISKTSVNDIFLHLSIYQKIFKSKIDNNTFKEQCSFKDSVMNYIYSNRLEEKVVSIPVFSDILYFYHKHEMRDSLELAKQKIDNIIEKSKVGPEELAYYYNVLVKIQTNDIEKEQYLIKSIKVFLPDFDLGDENLDSLIIKNVNYKNFYVSVLPNIKELIKINLAKAKKTQNPEDYDRCLNLLSSLLNSIEVLSNTVVDKNTGIYYSKEFEETGTLYIHFLYDMYEKTGNQKYLENLFNTAKKIKGFFLLKQMNQKLAFNNSKNKSKKEYIKWLMKKNENENKLQEAILIGNDEEVKKIKDSILDVDFKIIRLQIKMEKNTAFREPPSQNSNISQINNLLEDKEALVACFVADSVLYTSFITNTNTKVFKTLLPPNFTNLIKNFKREIKSGEELSDATNDELCRILIEPFYNDLKKIKHLVIIPHKIFTSIPFELIKDKKGNYGVESFNISYSLSISLWLKSREKKIQEIKEINLFAPVFANNQNKKQNILNRSISSSSSFSKTYNSNKENLSDLCFSKEEVKFISKECTKNGIKNKSFVANFATETNFKNISKNVDIVHIATHGYLNKKHPDLSGLFFYENKPDDDGFLFADEILNLKQKPNLIILSSCNSGTGILEGSEGVNSLQRHFIQAGVPNVIASLWKVNDKATKELMISFYNHLLNEKVSYSKALQLAKLDCIKKGFLPIDWAGFVLIGY